MKNVDVKRERKEEENFKTLIAQLRKLWTKLGNCKRNATGRFKNKIKMTKIY